MEVIFMSPCKLKGGGMGDTAYYICRELDKKKVLKSILTPAYRKGEISPLKIVTTYSRIYKFISRLPRLRWNIQGIIRGLLHDILATRKIEKCDIFHGWAGGCLFSLKRAKEEGAITLLENPTSHIINRRNIIYREEEIWGLSRSNYSFSEKICLREYELADYIIVPSEYAYNSFIKYGVPKERLFLRPYGVDTQKFIPKTKEDKIFRVLYVGAITPYKGFQYLLEAWRRLKLKNAELILVGPILRKSKKMLKYYAAKTDFKILGFVSNPVELYQQSSIFVFPSPDEGSALVTYEAMACGLPIITTYESGSVVRNGVEGFIISARSVEEIVGKIKFLYDNPKKRKEMGYNARKRAEEYTWERAGEETFKIYKKVLEGK